MFPQLYVPTALHSHSSMFPQFYVLTVHCSHSSMFPQLCIPIALCSHSSAFSQLLFPQSAFPQLYDPTLYIPTALPTVFEEKGEPKRNRTEVHLLTSQRGLTSRPNRLSAFWGTWRRCFIQPVPQIITRRKKNQRSAKLKRWKEPYWVEIKTFNLTFVLHLLGAKTRSLRKLVPVKDLKCLERWAIG